MFPRFGKDVWRENGGRLWKKAPAKEEWQELDIWEGLPFYIKSSDGLFPEEDEVIRLFKDGACMTVRMNKILEVSQSGFKCLALVFEV
jgi:hypothetical protein